MMFVGDGMGLFIVKFFIVMCEFFMMYEIDEFFFEFIVCFFNVYFFVSAEFVCVKRVGIFEVRFCKWMFGIFVIFKY